MNRHDSTYSDACRLARYAARARHAGDIATATRYETRALALAGLVPAGARPGIGQRSPQAAAGDAFNRETGT
jgi:hypothetical protein